MVEKFTNENGVSVDPLLGQHLITIMEEKSNEIAQVCHPGSLWMLKQEESMACAGTQ